MNDAELDKLLKAAPVPERAPEFWERLSQRVSEKLHWQQRRGEHVNLPSRPRAGVIWGWGFAGAAVLVLAGFFVGNWHSNRQIMALLQNEKLLREVLATFPNQVRAIIQDENGLHLTLAEQADVPQAQPLWLRICEGGRCRTVMTFSGQTVQVDGAQIEALAEADGGVMLVGEHFFWSSREGGAGGAIQINAQQLPHTL